MAGWARGERYPHRGDVPDSPGWSTEEKETVNRIQSELGELAIAVGEHPYWATVPVEKRVAARMDLKKQTRPADEPAGEPATAEAA
ncbi:hypothetical protein [Streptomyces katrae]|nr:hypothetical protein [Streptomyces katrae]